MPNIVTSDTATQVRLQLFRNGYHPIPNRGKASVPTGWNRPDFVARELGSNAVERVTSWPERWVDAQSTGIRLDNGLAVIDCDIDDAELAHAAEVIIRRMAPEIDASAPIRYGGGEFKQALFVRFEGTEEERFVRLASHEYGRPDELAKWRNEMAAAVARFEAAKALDAKAKMEYVASPHTHQIEIFGGKPTPKGFSSRQFGVYGPHSYDDNGAVVRDYCWDDSRPALNAIALSELPAMSRKHAAAIIDGFDAAAVELGWERVLPVKSDDRKVIYDLTDDMMFDTTHGRLDLAQLRDLVDALGEVRCSSSFIPGSVTATLSKCRASIRLNGLFGIFDNEADATHYLKSDEPGSHALGETAVALLNDLNDLNGLNGATAQAEPAADADPIDKVKWLLDSHGYFARENVVVELDATSLACRLVPAAFHMRFASWYLPPEGRRSKPLALTKLWAVAPQRIHLAGVRMRPDRPFPTYQEAGQTYKNTYRRPVHPTTGGQIASFVRFMERFLPDQREREWLLDWMSHKQAFPAVPGTCVVFIADNEDAIREGKFGCGRGLLFRIVHALYGEEYARSETFSMLDGSSGQSVYTDWMHGSVLVTVDESKASPTAYRRGERSAGYEVLKDIVDPAPKRRNFKGKYRAAFDGMSYCSFWVASNHADAFAIPEADRRFTVLRNGRQINPDEVQEIVAWMEDPTNIGALSRLLSSRRLAPDFDMYRPLQTAGKAEMAELSLSEVEHVLRDLIADRSKGVPIFHKQYLEDEVGRHFSVQGGHWRGEFREAWNRYCARITGPSGGPIRTRTGGTRKKLFCFRSDLAEVRAMPDAAVTRQAALWCGKMGPGTQLTGLDGGGGSHPENE